jgi:hypothetical protein
MHAACTSVGLRMDIAAMAETICFETPRSVKDRTEVLKGACSSFLFGCFGDFLSDSVGFRAFAVGESLIRSTGRLGSRCKVVGGFGGDGVVDCGALAANSRSHSISLSDSRSLSHSSNRRRLVGLGDCVSFSNCRLSPIIAARILDSCHEMEGSEFPCEVGCRSCVVQAEPTRQLFLSISSFVSQSDASDACYVSRWSGNAV